MIWLALTLLAPFGAGVAILALRRAPAAVAIAGAALGLAGALGLFASMTRGERIGAGLPFLPDFPISLEATPLTATLALLVATVTTAVLIHAAGYMARDPERVRFFGTMALFVAAMELLVLAGDWITLLAAWEMIGFSSYLLIGFWHGRPGVAGAALRAFLYTRSADLGLYLAVFLLIGRAGTSDIAATLDVTGTPALIAGLLLLVAAAGKSAQLPFQEWLLRAMAGPTPVSALLHSATLVAAGAILLIRTAPMLPEGVLVAVGLVGGATAVVTGLMALAERDLKRLLAASTASQYGFMLIAIAAGAPVAALLHLIAHAAIKSALFLGAGVFQHDRESTALEALAGAGRARPGIFAGFALAALALAGLPPMAAWFSKEAILTASWASPLAPWLMPSALAGALISAAYMGRALRVLWAGSAERAKAPVPFMAAGLWGLAALAATLGAAFGPLEALLGAAIAEGPRFLPLLGLAAAAGGLVLGWTLPPDRLLGPLFRQAETGFGIARALEALSTRPVLALAEAVERLETAVLSGILASGRAGLALAGAARRIDRDAIDGAIFALVDRLWGFGQRLRRLQSGLIHRELALSMIGIALLVAVLLIAPLSS